MPKSKRNRIVPLSVVKKKGKDLKTNKIDLIRKCVDDYKNVFIFSYDHLKTEKLQTIRKDWPDSRIFMGKNKVARVAFGKTPSEEAKDGLSDAGKKLVGNKGLLFTNSSSRDVLKYFNTLTSPAFATAGNIATETVVLDAGPLEQFPFSLEPRLRALGLHTALKKGVVLLEQEQVICESGKPLSSDAARILELLGIQMAEFKMNMEYCWNEEKGLINLTDDTATVEKVKKSKQAVAKVPVRRSARVKNKESAEQEAVAEQEDEEAEMEVN